MAHVLVVSEGARDATRAPDTTFRGVVVILVQRLLQEALGRRIEDHEVDGGRMPRSRDARGFAPKVYAVLKSPAMALAQPSASPAPKFDSFVFVVDRDRYHADRLAQLEAGRAHAETDTETFEAARRTVVALAIEAVEAWLLADHEALRSTLNADRGVPNPEGLSQPYVALAELISAAGFDHADEREVYDKLARAIDLKTLEARCSSFKRLAVGVRSLA